mmetsp:Transcript_62190/g.175329  ORF Transcript_62190/g.175329 Transcript_62190/m.175329 type:complete len:294 (+) Transcript_62190:593-1474(+)
MASRTGWAGRPAWPSRHSAHHGEPASRWRMPCATSQRSSKSATGVNALTALMPLWVLPRRRQRAWSRTAPCVWKKSLLLMQMDLVMRDCSNKIVIALRKRWTCCCRAAVARMSWSCDPSRPAEGSAHPCQPPTLLSLRSSARPPAGTGGLCSWAANTVASCAKTTGERAPGRSSPGTAPCSGWARCTAGSSTSSGAPGPSSSCSSGRRWSGCARPPRAKPAPRGSRALRDSCRCSAAGWPRPRRRARGSSRMAGPTTTAPTSTRPRFCACCAATPALPMAGSCRNGAPAAWCW